MYIGYFSSRCITRLTALYGMAVSIVVMTILSVELNGEEKGRGKIAILLGIDIDEFDINHKQCNSSAVANTDNSKYISPGSVYIFVLSCYIYSLVEIVANALLVWGTLLEKLWCAVPWFVCKSINLSIQFIGFIYYITMDDRPENQVLTTALFNFVITLSFWCTVYQTVQRWRRQDSPDISYTHIVVEEDNSHQADPSQMTQAI